MRSIQIQKFTAILLAFQCIFKSKGFYQILMMKQETVKHIFKLDEIKFEFLN